MSDTNKMFYHEKKEFRLFGIKVAEWEDHTTRYDGSGQLIAECLPDKQYFEMEFLRNKGDKK